jgi:hypothetical protein
MHAGAVPPSLPAPDHFLGNANFVGTLALEHAPYDALPAYVFAPGLGVA